MSDYSRRISYIYEYENGEKGQNKGYIKTEVRQDKGKMDIELRELKPSSLSEATVGYYLWKGGRIKACGYRKEQLTGRNSSIVLDFNPKDMEGVSLSEICGVIIRCSDIIYTAEWSEEEFDLKLVDWVDSLKEIMVEAKPKEKPADELAIQEIPDFLKVKKKEKNKNIKYDKSYHMKINNWKDMFKKYDIVEPFNDDIIQPCVEIGYEDLKYLPSSCKNVVNNSFLLHGLYYYRHVLIGRQRCRKAQKIYMLGVPGRYENSERMIAAMFGFDNFKAAQRNGINCSNFGYWYTLFRDDE